MMIYLLTLLGFLFSTILRAEVLKDIIITGNKTTKKEAIISHAQINLGQDLTIENVKEIKKNLSRINQFRLKNIEFKEGILKIEIEDKWTLFPVPMITESGNYHSRGFLIYDDNFLGRLGTFAPGIFWTNSHFNYLLYFQDESLFSPTLGIKFLTMKRTEYIEFKRQDSVINQHESHYDSILITPNYIFNNQVVKAGPILIRKKIYTQKGSLLFNENPKGLFFRHHLNAYTARDIMFEGVLTTFDTYALKSNGRKTVLRNEFDVYWSKSIAENFFNLDLHGHLINDNSYLFPKYLGGDEGYRGYDKSSFPAINNLGIMTQYQLHLFKRIYLAPFYEYNSSKLIAPILDGKTISESTVGAGIRYYFKKISIPAIIFDAAKNIDDNSYHFHMNIGISI